jgi:hypothetical protein
MAYKKYQTDRSKKQRQEGAAMLVVMMVLLISTAASAVAVQSAGFEMRAAGHGRRFTQTQYVAEAALVYGVSYIDRIGGPRAVLHGMKTSGPPPMDIFGEPDLVGTGYESDGYRMASNDFYGESVPPVRAPTTEDPGSLGPKQAYEPWFAVDIMDVRSVPAVDPGYHVEGYGQLSFAIMNVVARGFTIPRFQMGPGSDVEDENYRVGESAHTACSCVVSGPFAP